MKKLIILLLTGFIIGYYAADYFEELPATSAGTGQGGDEPMSACFPVCVDR